MHAIIKWKIKPEYIREELDLLAAMFEKLASERPEGLKYSTFRLDDGVSFIA